MARFGDLPARTAASAQRVFSTDSNSGRYQQCEERAVRASSCNKTSPWMVGCSGAEAKDWSAEATRVRATLDEEVRGGSCAREANLLASLQTLEASSSAAAFDSDDDDDLRASRKSLSLGALKQQAGQAASRLSTAVATRKNRALYQSQRDSVLEEGSETTVPSLSPWDQATQAQQIKAALDAEVRGKHASLHNACLREAQLLASLASCSNQQQQSAEQKTHDSPAKKPAKLGERVGASLQWVSAGLAARKERALYSSHVDGEEWDQEGSVWSLPSSPGLGPASPADAAGVRAILDAKLKHETWPAWPQGAGGEAAWPSAADTSSPWSPWTQDDCQQQSWSWPVPEKEQPMLAEVAKLPSEDLQTLLRKISQCRPDDVRAALGAVASDASTADTSGSETSSELDLPISPNSVAKSSPWSLATLRGSRSLRFAGKAAEQHNEDVTAPLW